MTPETTLGHLDRLEAMTPEQQRQVDVLVRGLCGEAAVEIVEWVASLNKKDQRAFRIAISD
jgi:hypothetical protein